MMFAIKFSMENQIKKHICNLSSAAQLSDTLRLSNSIVQYLKALRSALCLLLRNGGNTYNTFLLKC